MLRKAVIDSRGGENRATRTVALVAIRQRYLGSPHRRVMEISGKTPTADTADVFRKRQKPPQTSNRFCAIENVLGNCGTSFNLFLCNTSKWA